jgi:O-antigen/teichoic acid export membrane protein
VATQIPSDDHPQVSALGGRKRRWRLPVPAPGPVVGSLASAAVGQVALVGTGVVTARVLGPVDRGYLALVILVPTVLHGIGALGLPRAVTYFIADDPAHEASVLRAIRLPAIAQAVVLTALQAGVLTLMLADDPARVKWAGVAVLPLLTANLADMYGRAILQGQRRYAVFNILRNAALSFYLVGVLLLVAAGQAGLVEFSIAYVVATVLSAIVTLTIALSRSTHEPRPTEVSRSKLFRFGLRGYLAWLSPGTVRLDQAVIGLLLSPHALGLYVVGLAFSNLPTFISRSIGFIAFPQVAGATTARGDEMRRFLWLSIALSGGAVLALEVAAGWLVPLFFGPEFDGAVPLTRVLLLAAFFEGARHILKETSSGSGRPGIGSVAELSSWLVLIPAVAVLMPLWDAKGVAAATAFASAASFLILVTLVRNSGDASSRPATAHGPQG